MGKSYSSRELIEIITRDGWYFVEQEGSHRHYKHFVRLGKVTIPHPRKDVPLKTARSVLKQAGLLR